MIWFWLILLLPVLYLVIGQLAVRISARSIAAKNTFTKHQLGVGDNRWVDVDKYNSYKTEYSAQPLNGQERGGPHGPYMWQSRFRRELNRMRWLWPVEVPNLIIRADTNRLIAKYDPASLKAKEDEFESRMRELDAWIEKAEIDIYGKKVSK